jgi:pimeloyl-ACP methyl ester carboxylesterase
MKPLLLAFSLAPLLAAHAAPLSWQPHIFTAQDKERTTVRGFTATLSAPENPAQPTGPQVQLHLMRLPTSAASPSTPIVYLHGGPGGSSVEHLESPDFRALFARLQQRADVILLDQRGCGKSTPSLVPGLIGRPVSDTLASREYFLAHLESTSAAVRDRLRASGHDTRHYTILTSAADLEVLRAALGVERIDLFAHSYGTQLAQAYVRRFPQSVGRMVLVGSRGMDTSRKLPGEADDFLSRIAALAKQDPTVGTKFPDLVATLRRVLAKLDAAPLAVEMENEKKEKVTLRVGGFALRFIVAKFYLNDPDNFRYLPKILDEIDSGRRPWSLIFNLAQLIRSPVSYAWFTTDAASGVSEARAERIAAEAKTALLSDAMNFPFPAINRVWQMTDLGNAFRAPVETSTPTLFIAGSLDGITPVSQTREIMRTFARAQLLVVENGGHNSQLRPRAVVDAIHDFLAGRSAPDRVEMPPPQFMPLITQR